MDRLLILLDKDNLAQYKRYRKRLLHIKNRFAWMLPPIIQEKDRPFYEDAINKLYGAGSKYWHLGHISQRQLFSQKKDVRLSASYTANVLNSLSMRSLYDLGITEVEFSIETDMENLKEALAHADDCSVGLTVYGRPPLFTSRLLPPGLSAGSTLKSPKGEVFYINCYQDLTLVHFSHPYSLLAYRENLERLGLSFVVIDFTWERPAKNVLSSILQGKSSKKARSKADTFNFLRPLA